MKAQPNRYSILVAPTGRARCRACKGLVACGAVRLVMLAVVSERPRRVTKFVRHGTCVSGELAKLVLQAMVAMSSDVDKVPVVGEVGGEELERLECTRRCAGRGGTQRKFTANFVRCLTAN